MNKEYFTETRVLQYLKSTMKDKMNLLNGIPRLYANEAELGMQFNNTWQSITETIEKINSTKLPSHYKVELPNLSKPHLSTLKSDLEVFYVEQQRRIILSNERVPKWVYGVLLLLGWNELWIILGNPIYLILASLTGLVALVIIQMGMVGVVQQMAENVFKMVVEKAKEQIDNRTSPSKEKSE
eukprot:NODE_273_length_11040_cov_1.244036.p7 type:complete len:183 gc:universal NODE_273_length_11040_cov_1.244036:6905-6357(-)